MTFGPKDKREAEVFALENVRADMQYAIVSLMNHLGVSRKELAERLGCTAANISQILSEDGNPKLDTIARIFHALGDEARITSRILEKIQMQKLEGEFRESWEEILQGTFAGLGRSGAASKRPIRRPAGQPSVQTVMAALEKGYRQTGEVQEPINLNLGAPVEAA